jgi:rod shape-determining protein MreC
MNTTDTGGKTVVVDRGASSGIQKNMAVITAEGIVGKVIDVYPSTANVLLITDASFGAGVVSVKNQVLGELRGQGTGMVKIDNVQNEEKVEPGDWFVTSGQDLVFPRGLNVGQVAVVRGGKSSKEIYVAPSGIQNLTEVLIVTDAVQHGTLPEGPAANQPVHLLKPPPGEDSTPAADPAATGAPGTPMQTDADKVTQRYKLFGPIGDQNRPAPNFNATPRAPSKPPPASPAGPPPDSPPNP